MSMVEGLSIVCLTGELPDEDWVATERNNHPCECGGDYEYYFNAKNGRLLICHLGVDGELWGTLVTHLSILSGGSVLGIERCLGRGVHEGKV